MLALSRLSKKFLGYRHVNSSSQGDYKPVYRFPYVRGVGLINRMKFYQTVLSVTAIPGIGICNFLGLLSQDELLLTTAFSIIGLVPLYTLGHFTNRLIGIVYLNENKNLVKIAFLNFWGTRTDVVMSLDDIVPLSEIPPSFLDPLYLKVRRVSSSKPMKLCMRFGVLDNTGFNKIFP